MIINKHVMILFKSKINVPMLKWQKHWGGGGPNVYVVSKGGWPNVYVCPQGGGGESKNPDFLST